MNERLNTMIALDLFKKSGHKGGKATLKKRGKRYFREIGKRGAKIRWDKNKKSLVSISSE